MPLPSAAVGSLLAGVVFSNWVYFAPIFGQRSGFAPVEISNMLAAAMLVGRLEVLSVYVLFTLRFWRD